MVHEEVLALSSEHTQVLQALCRTDCCYEQEQGVNCLHSGNPKLAQNRTFAGADKARASQAYLRYWTSHDPAFPQTMPSRLHYVVQHTMKKGYRDLRFLRHTGKQRAIATMVNQLTKAGGPKTLIGFGDMGRADSGGFIKRCVRGPVAQLRSALEQVCCLRHASPHNLTICCPAQQIA